MPALSAELTAPNGVKYAQPTGLFINNEWVESSNGQKITSVNPTDETDIISVYAATATDVDAAVDAARAAFKNPAWRDISPTDRGNLLIALSDLVNKHKKIIATIDTWDNGKIYADASGDVEEAANVFRYYGGYADKIHGQTMDMGPDKLAYTILQPVGVCGQIIPWNFPMGMAAWKLGPALACGNTVVIKAAEQTPLSILYMANLIKEAGFPPGVVNILNGYGREAGAAIATHTGIDKVAFTGSTMTGKEVMKMAAGTMKNITLETGGKSPLLVFEDADLEQAVKWAHLGLCSSTPLSITHLTIAGIFFNQGQVCTATSRILVQDTIYDKFIASFKDQIKEVSVVGDPFAETTTQGPQVTKTQYERVLRYVKSGKDEGATLLAGGEAFTKVGPAGKGFFINPTVFTDVKPHMKIYREEVFGPFVVIASFKTEDEAVEMANDTTYGLGSAVFTRDIMKAHRVARNFEAGMVWINSSNDSHFRVPFGGVKQSGIGRELGEEGLKAYSQVKSVHVNLGIKL
ncbi:hypothetical protein B7494_g5038 [Chlorociboria aeruginascens]|nr:hypothetical protein B7494_g5038 [Chlorociboria aeruginascens]